MFVSDEHQFLFFHIPKCAGTVIERRLAVQLGVPKWKTEWSCNDWGTHDPKNEATENQYTKHLRPYRYAKMNPAKFKDYYKVAVVRNPWAWHLSFYGMLTQWPKFASVEGHYAKTHKGRIHPMNDYADFDQYVRLASEGIGPADVVQNMSPQAGSPCHRFLQNTPMPRAADRNAKLMVDYIISFKDLQGGLDKVCDKVGIERIDMDKRDSDMPAGRGEPSDCSSKHPHYTEVFTKTTAAIVAKNDRVDIKSFGWQYGDRRGSAIVYSP